MPQVIEEQQANTVVKSSAFNAALGYIMLALTPVVLKWLGLIDWPWSKVTFTLWGPWVLAVVVNFIGWAWYLIQRRRA